MTNNDTKHWNLSNKNDSKYKTNENKRNIFQSNLAKTKENIFTIKSKSKSPEHVSNFSELSENDSKEKEKTSSSMWCPYDRDHKTF